MGKKSDYSLLSLIGILLVPGSIFWILYRYGFGSIIDALAVGILVGFGILKGIKFLISKKVIKFGK